MPKDIHTYIEPELEARITALVLGEVSEFDVEELEQIIAAKPELQIFRRRMEAIHELIGKTVKPEKDEAWQLSEDRRAELRRAFARQKEPARNRSRTVPRAQWRSAIGIAACVVVCLVIFTVMNIERPPMDHFTPEIVSYQAAYSEAPAESDGDNLWGIRNEEGSAPQNYPRKRASKGAENTLRDKYAFDAKGKKKTMASDDAKPLGEVRYKSKVSGAKRKPAVPALGEIALSGEVFKKETLVDELSENNREMNRVVARKPSAPSSSMAKVIASHTMSSSTIPVPETDVPDPSVDFGSSVAFGDADGFEGGDAFGDGWENGGYVGSAKESELGRDSLVEELVGQEVAVTGTISSLDESGSFGFSGRAAVINSVDKNLRGDVDKVRGNGDVAESGIGIVREFIYPTEYEPPELPNLVMEKSDKVSSFPAKPATPSSFETRSTGVTIEVKEEVALEPLQEIPVVGALFTGKKNAKPVVPQATKKPAVKSIPSPKRPQPLPEETSTSAQPFSTFSLNVSDVSFKLAKVALLEKGQWPDAAKVRTEEFVNAFDYGDPSPRRGEPVACAIEQSTHPFMQQRNLLRIGMKTAALGRSTPLRLTVLLDNSGSMEREDREASVLAAMRVLAAQLGPQDKITLVGFARQPRLLADRMSGDKAGQLVNIVANTPSEGGTNLEEALRLARSLAKRQHTDGAQDRIVLITDGVANLGNTVPEELSREIETMRQEGIAFDACGVGAEGLNDDILEALTRKGDGRYYFLNRPEDADSGFAKQLAGALSPAAKNVKVQVVFNPKRVSKYRLLGFEKHRLNKEDFRNDQVDAAEMAAEEAGNAVYQINPIPDGEGELGEVFVRFLDTNTGKMVERSWPLTYESQAKRFSEATPSMQLAGAAAMLGEKLHGTDAGSVRFSMISNTLGKLRAHYAADRKVQDLIRMCEKVE